jgi:hypothetical protein
VLPNESSSGIEQQQDHHYNESYMLLQKLMENLRGNPSLQNAHIKQTFKLGHIRKEKDLEEKKNLLNSMAALFYTNHRMGTVTGMFRMWRELA